MQNVSLSTAGSTPKSQSGNGGLWVLFIVFVLTLLLYGGLYLYRNKLDTDIQAAKDSYAGEYAKLRNDKTKEIIDFNNRTGIAKSLTLDERNVQEGLIEIEKLMVDGVYLESLKYDEATKSISLLGASNNFNSIAKQILSFKGSNYFTDVSGGKSKLNEDTGMVEFDVSMKFKNETANKQINK